MDMLEITRRTKDAIRAWAEQPNTEVVLADKLSKFQNGDLDNLRVRTNQEFAAQPGFPFTTKAWEKLELKIVKDVRDAAKKRLEEGQP